MTKTKQTGAKAAAMEVNAYLHKIRALGRCLTMNEVSNFTAVIAKHCPEDKTGELVERLAKATSVFRHNWSCHDCEGYKNSTNEPNDEPMCEHCKENDILLSAIDFALAEYGELNK